MGEMDASGLAGPASARTRVRRGAPRARYRRDEVLAILDAGLIAHVGVTTPDGPLVLPMAYGRDEERLYLHGAAANHLLGTGAGEEICVTVTHLDGLVMARTPFHNSMNYRSVVVRGEATRIDDERRKRYALRLITDHIVANWDTSRPPSQIDLRRTLVLELPLAEASAKVRTGDPIDEPEDIAGPWWAGVVPISTRFEVPEVSADYTGDAGPPVSVAHLAGRSPDDRAPQVGR
ncbi:MAG: pyridoxamine 5'-phosphate oxidase family protein [Acidimicrobiia bacterium]|nr:pyridoxamine 5'-phosphate oxidase family protein [Acidimicrobiia bacterium]MYB25002.1 pyridoxamine 5'-phosphate oxidase family protein [Acidimicrobiia bacterium]MYE68088.1 pyridoxamine 5'-phosphate oxidase family protein [Acidimicrobiia bacterium]MYJ13335.1 pyridoxamine 5'-phosphate oxidase family protein [Acidimicrobiia bacterium]